MWRSLVFVFTIVGGFYCRTLENEVVPAVEAATRSQSDASGQRIIGGFPTPIEKYPYVVQVLRTNQFTCGGSLVLTAMTVLSSAHCFVGSNGSPLSHRQFSVRAGTAQLNSGGQTRLVSKIINHEQYNMVPRDNDVAILVLKRSFTLGPSIGLAILGGYDPPDNATVWHVGWGATFLSVNPNAVQLSNQLLEVSVYVVNQNNCVYNYNFLNSQPVEGRPFLVTSGMICAGVWGVGGRDACTGDSGGPLIHNGQVVGVTSWGFGCAEAYYPGVSARVSSYIQWINTTVQTNDIARMQASVLFLLGSFFLIVALCFRL